jgi:hypothetical protein
LRLCNNLFRKVQELHELRHSDIPSERYVAQWEELTEEFNAIKKTDIEEHKKNEKGKASSVLESIPEAQTLNELGSSRSEFGPTEANTNSSLKENLEVLKNHLKDHFNIDFNAEPIINKEHLRNP